MLYVNICLGYLIIMKYVIYVIMSINDNCQNIIYVYIFLNVKCNYFYVFFFIGKNIKFYNLILGVMKGYLISLNYQLMRLSIE